MKKALCLLLALLLALLMPGCGAAQGAPTVPETPESEALIITGDYTLFALSYADQLVAADAMELFSTLTLAENGGSLTIGAEQGRVLDWEVRDGQLTLHSTLGSFSGTVADGVAVLTSDGETRLYYAAPCADLSAYSPLDRDALEVYLLQEALGETELPDMEALLESLPAAPAESEEPEGSPAP